MSCEFSRIGSHSRCWCVRTPSKTLQHFVAFERHASLRRERPGQYGAPHRVRVQHRSGVQSAHDRKVQQCFGGRPPVATHDSRPSSSISRKCAAVKAPLSKPVEVMASRSGSMRENRAEVAARAQHPPARVKVAPERG